MIQRDNPKIPSAVWVWFGALIVAAVPPVITEVGQYLRERAKAKRKEEST